MRNITRRPDVLSIVGITVSAYKGERKYPIDQHQFAQPVKRPRRRSGQISDAKM